MIREELPEWIEVKPYDKQSYQEMSERLIGDSLVTVCVEANCPNRYECFSQQSATFMILGDVCTRNCLYCNIQSGKPTTLDDSEPLRVARAIDKLGLAYAVITCVTRDDLRDGGAHQFVQVLRMIRKIRPVCKVEVLISDLAGDWDALKLIVDEQPFVLNHNIEIVEELFGELRPKGFFQRSLELLRVAKEFDDSLRTKSGLMVGLGETDEQIHKTMKELRKVGCDILTIGQYLQPSPLHASVKKYYHPEEFARLERAGLAMGFQRVVAGPLVRSSYKAQEAVIHE